MRNFLTSRPTGIATRFGLRLAACLIVPAIAGLSQAGNLDRCDLARIAARNSVLNTYSQVFSELNDMTSDAKRNETDRTEWSYTDRDGREHSVDIPVFLAELSHQESADLGHTDRNVAGACRSGADALHDAAEAAGALAKLDISAVLARHLPGIDLSRLLPRS